MKIISLNRCALSTCAIVSLAACNSGGSRLAPTLWIENPIANAIPLDEVKTSPKSDGWLSPLATNGQSLIYVANRGEVVIFPERGTNPAPVGVITKGVASAYGLYVDGHRNLYVANTVYGRTVSVYSPGTLAPSIVYSDPRRPLYPVTDHTSRLYVSNRDGTVSEFPPGKTSPDRILHTPGVEADGLNLDSAGNLYVAYRGPYGDGSIEEFAPGATQGHVLGMEITQPQALVVDRKGNILVVESEVKESVIVVFPPGSSYPSQQLVLSPGVTQIALRESERFLYISNYATQMISVGSYPLRGTHLKIADPELKRVQGIAASNEEHF